MSSCTIEESIIHWANHHLGSTKYSNLEEMLDGEFFLSILKSQNADDASEGNQYGFSMGDLETTLSILQNFYIDYDNIMEHSDYREIVTNDVICTEMHVISITELVIGILIK